MQMFNICFAFLRAFFNGSMPGSFEVFGVLIAFWTLQILIAILFYRKKVRF